MTDLLTLLAGLVCAGVGGELFVRAAVRLARAIRVSPAVVGATVAAFATSSPELSVSVLAAVAGDPQIGLGDALGSNVVNVALILGLIATAAPLHGASPAAGREWAVALAVPLATGLLVLIDGMLSRLDGVLMMAAFAVWLAAVVRAAHRQRVAFAPDEAPGGDRRPAWAVGLAGAAGLVLLFVAGRLVVGAASSIALALGINDFVIGATLVAAGTSMPELATALVARLRGHDDVGLGTLLGSNIFNGLFIVPLVAVIHPIAVDWREIVVTLAFGVAALACVRKVRDVGLRRGRGLMLLAIYAVYLALLPGPAAS